jgi:2-hydroxy-6-oxonona-2,4-dienedioate hydrolase
MSHPLPPLEQELPPEALRVLAHATRHTTPCGDGEAVWHAWGDGEPLVLLHGGSGSWAHWVRNVEALAAAGRRVLVPDLPGFGDSALPPGNKDADGVAPVIAEGLPHLVGMRAVDIVGFSFGGLTGGLLAAAHPELVRRLVLVGAPALGLRDKPLPLTAWRHFEEREARLEAHRHNLGVLMLHDPATIDDTALLIQAANVPHDRMARRKLARTDVLLRSLPRIECRVDAIYGEQDALYAGRIEEVVERLRTAPTLGEIVLLPGTGHWAQYENPARFNQELLRLLGQAPNSP